MRKTFFCLFLPLRKTKMQISCAVTAQVISAFVFTTQIVQFLIYLQTKFQAFSFLLGLYRSVFVRPGKKSYRPVFSHSGSNIFTSCYDVKEIQLEIVKKHYGIFM